MKILGVCGSLQASSTNLSLLRSAAALAPAGVAFEVYERLADLPLFNPDLETSAPLPAVTDWRRALASNDALLISSPEYGMSLPGALKNAIDWVIGSAELNGKIVAITASTPALTRGRFGLRHLRETLTAIGVVVVGGEPIVRGPSVPQEIRALLASLVAKVEEVRGSSDASGPAPPSCES